LKRKKTAKCEKEKRGSTQASSCKKMKVELRKSRKGVQQSNPARSSSVYLVDSLLLTLRTSLIVYLGLPTSTEAISFQASTEVLQALPLIRCFC